MSLQNESRGKNSNVSIQVGTPGGSECTRTSGDQYTVALVVWNTWLLVCVWLASHGLRLAKPCNPLRPMPITRMPFPKRSFSSEKVRRFAEGNRAGHTGAYEGYSDLKRRYGPGYVTVSKPILVLLPRL
jgi:hypothetical protein